jgi:hypothetical protein
LGRSRKSDSKFKIQNSRGKSEKKLDCAEQISATARIAVPLDCAEQSSAAVASHGFAAIDSQSFALRNPLSWQHPQGVVWLRVKAARRYDR